jgi:hypothetical protein
MYSSTKAFDIMILCKILFQKTEDIFSITNSIINVADLI